MAAPLQQPVVSGRETERAAAETLSEALGGLPLAHEQAAAYCERLTIMLAEYHKRFEAAPGRLLDTDKDAPSEYHDGLTVAKTFALAINGSAPGWIERYRRHAGKSALRTFEPPLSAAAPSPDREGQKQDTAAPILPSLPVEGLKLAGVHAMPGEHGQMLCLFYARPDAANIALCVEKAVDQSDTVAHAAGNFPSAAVHWRQRGANYALVGALPEAGLRSLADRVRAQVEAFDAR